MELNRGKTSSKIMRSNRASIASEPNRYGLDLATLRSWSAEKTSKYLSEESSKQEIAVAKVRAFLDAIITIVKLQSWWRMMMDRKKFLDYLYHKRYMKRTFYRAWHTTVVAQKKYLHIVIGKYFDGWREVANEEKRLHLILIQFVNISIQRLKLTPPACMAFFDELKWQHVLSTSDRMKIRRLILETLFRGWTLQCRQQRLSRYKASQVLSRMIRRTKGPMWVKESCLVCFHLWYRFTALKNAYRREMPDPLFKNPYLPQWAVVLKDINLKRIKKTRTLEKGHILTQKRSWRKWRRLMSIDRTKAVTPLAVALQHFKEVWLTKVLAAWSGVVRDRGRVMRFKDKIFYRWRRHIPVFKKLNKLKREADEWIRLRRLRKSYDVMIQICLVVVNKRSESLRKLRKVFCDRKIMVCAYALMHRNEHVMMIECWRRLKVFWRNRQRWKAFLWNYKVEYHGNKSRAIFDAWKSFVRVSKVEKMVPLPNTGTPVTGGVDEEERTLFNSLPHRVFNLMMLALAGRLRLKPDQYEHRLICCAISQNLHNVLREQKGLSSVPDGVQDRLQAALDTNNLQDIREALDQGAQVEPKHIYQVGSNLGDHCLATFAALLSRAVYFMAERVSKQDIPETLNKISHPLNTLLLATHMHRWNCNLHRHVKSANAKKQQNPGNRLPEKKKPVNLTVREVNSLTDSTATATSFGGPNQSIQLWRCVVLQLLDSRAQYLISTCKQLPESRTLDEEVAEVMKRKKLARIQQVQQSLVQIVGVKFGGEALAEVFREKFEEQPSLLASASFSTSLHTHESDNGKDDADLMEIHYQLREIPPVVKSDIPVVPKARKGSEVNITANAESVASSQSRSTERNIYDVLQQYLMLTGRMIAEARAVRIPLLERDRQLLISGAMKNTRNEYLALRRQCMTAKELQEEADKKAKKSKGKDGNGNKSPKSKGSKKKKSTKKVNKKSKKGVKIEEGGESADENSMGRNSQSDGQEGESAIEDDLDTEMFLIIYPTIPEPEPDLNLNINVSVDLNLSAIQLADEAEWEAEYGYLRRMRRYRHFFLETWVPVVKAHHMQNRIEKHMKVLEIQEKKAADKIKESKMILSERIVRETKFIPRRLLDLVSRDEHFKRTYSTFLDLQAANQAQAQAQAQSQSQSQSVERVPKIAAKASSGDANILEMAKIHRSGGVGLWILDYMLSDFEYRNSSTWATVPLEWWLPTLINEHVKNDQVRTEASLTAVNTTLFDAKDRLNDAEKDATRYQKYLKKLRNELLAISVRQRGKTKEDKDGRAAVTAAVHKVNSKISACSKQMKTLSDAISLSELMVATGNLQEAYAALNSNTAPSTNTVSSAGSANLQITGAMVYRKIESAKEEIVSLGERVQQLEVSKLECEALVQGYDQRCNLTTLMLKELGVDKFNVLVDVQQLLKRTNSALKTHKNDATSVEMLSWRKFLVNYRKRLDRFQRYKLLPRKDMWTRELDARRMREFLYRRPGSESNNGSGQNTGNNTSRIPSARSRPSSGFLPDIPAPLSGSGRRSGLLTVDVDSFIAVTRRSSPAVMAEEHFHEFDDGSESMPPDTVMNTDHGADFELTDAIAADETDLVVDLEQQQLDAEAELEEMFLSSENRRRRDEESRLLQDAEKLAVEQDDLRMVVFDEYWALLPTREAEVEDATEAGTEEEEEEAAPLPEVIKEPPISEVENRTTRMWKSIGESRLREKREIIEQFAEDDSSSGEGNAEELRLLLNSIRIARSQDSDDDSQRKKDTDSSGNVQVDPTQHMFLQVPMVQHRQLAEEVWKKGALPSTSVSMRPGTANTAKVETISDLIDKNIATANAEAVEDGRARSASVLSSSVASIKSAVLEANANINKQWKMDPFIVAGKQQVDRFRAGFTHRTTVLFENGLEDDTLNGSADTGRDFVSPMRSPTEDMDRLAVPPANVEAPLSSISLPASGSSIIEEEEINVQPSKSLSDQHYSSVVFSDELSEASSRASQRHERQHQRAVDEYLHLIEEKDGMSLSHMSQRSVQSGGHAALSIVTPPPPVDPFVISPAVSVVNSIKLSSRNISEEEKSKTLSQSSKLHEAAAVDQPPEVVDVATSRRPLIPPSTAALSLHPSTPPEFLVFDSVSVMSSVSKVPSLSGEEKEHASPKFLRIGDETFQPTGLDSLSGVSPIEESADMVERDRQSTESRAEAENREIITRFVPNDINFDEISLRSSNSKESIRSIHTSLHSANQYMEFMPRKSSDNIAVCSMVDGRLQWALQPTTSRERAESPHRVHFDDSMLFSPSVISLTNLSTQSNVRNIESDVEPEKDISQLRLSSRLGLVSPPYHHSDAEHDGFLGSEFLLSAEESLYDIAQGLTEEHLQEIDKQRKFTKFKDQTSNVTFFPSDFFSGQDRSTLRLQVQRTIKSGSKKALTQEDKDADLRAEIKREREIQQQILQDKVAQLAVDDAKKEELANLQLIAVNNIVNFVNTVEELQNREPYVPKNYSKEFGHLSRALKDIKKLQNPKRTPNPNSNVKPTSSPNQIPSSATASGLNANALLEVDVEDDSSQSSALLSVPGTGPSPTVSEAMKVQKLQHPRNPESDRSYSFRSSSTQQNNKLNCKSASEVGLNVPHPLTVSLLQQSSSEGRLAQPRKRDKVISRPVEMPAPTAAAVEELLTVVRDQSSMTSYDQAVEQAVQLLFGYDAHVSSHHGTEVESQTSRLPDLDHDNRPFLAKEYERSLDRSNALASAQIISMMLTKDKAPDPRPPINASLESVNSDQSAVRDPYASKVAGEGQRSPIPKKITFDGDALSVSLRAAAANTAAKSASVDQGRSISQSLQRRDHEGKAAALKKDNAMGSSDTDLNDLVLVGSSNSRPQLPTAAEGTATSTRNNNNSFSWARTAPLSLLEYRQLQQQQLQQQQQQQDGGDVKYDMRVHSNHPYAIGRGGLSDAAEEGENSFAFVMSDEKLFQSTASLPYMIDTHPNLFPGFDTSMSANDTEFSRTHTRSRDPGARTPLSPPSVSLTGFDFLRQPSLKVNPQPVFIPKPMTQDDRTFLRNGGTLLSDDDERDMERELRAYLSSGSLTVPPTAVSDKKKGRANIPRKNGKLLPPLCSTPPEVVERQVGLKGQHPDRVETVYVGLSTVLKSKGAYKPALQPQTTKKATKAGGRVFVLDPLDASAFVSAPALAAKSSPNKHPAISAGNSKVMMMPTVPLVGPTSSGVLSSSGSIVSGKNSHLSNIS